MDWLASNWDALIALGCFDRYPELYRYPFGG